MVNRHPVHRAESFGSGHAKTLTAAASRSCESLPLIALLPRFALKREPKSDASGLVSHETRTHPAPPGHDGPCRRAHPDCHSAFRAGSRSSPGHGVAPAARGNGAYLSHYGFSPHANPGHGDRGARCTDAHNGPDRPSARGNRSPSGRTCRPDPARDHVTRDRSGHTTHPRRARYIRIYASPRRKRGTSHCQLTAGSDPHSHSARRAGTCSAAHPADSRYRCSSNSGWRGRRYIAARWCRGPRETPS